MSTTTRNRSRFADEIAAVLARHPSGPVSRGGDPTVDQRLDTMAAGMLPGPGGPDGGAGAVDPFAAELARRKAAEDQARQAANGKRPLWEDAPIIDPPSGANGKRALWEDAPIVDNPFVKYLPKDAAEGPWTKYAPKDAAEGPWTKYAPKDAAADDAGEANPFAKYVTGDNPFAAELARRRAAARAERNAALLAPENNPVPPGMIVHEAPGRSAIAGPDGTMTPITQADARARARVEAERAESPTLMAVDDAVRSVARGVPFVGPFMDRASATVASLTGGNYDDELAYQRARDAAYDEASPVASTIGKVAGGLAGTFAAAPAGAAGYLFGTGGKTIPAMVGRGAVAGATQGAAMGAGGTEDLTDAGRLAGDTLQGAAIGGAAGVAIPGVIGAAGGLARGGQALARKVTGGADEALPTPESVREAAEAAYRRADEAGVIIAPAGVEQLGKSLTGQLADFGYHPTLHPKAAAVVKEVERLAGENVTLKGVDQLRRIARNVAGSADPSEARIGVELVERIDDFVDNLDPGAVLAGDAAAGSAALKEGRALWSRLKKSELLTDALQRAERGAAASGSGANIDNATRQRLRSILDNPKQARLFSATEREMLESLVRGTPERNALRWLGKLAPTGAVSGLASGAGGFAVGTGIGGPLGAMAGVAIPATGYVAKRFADRGTRNAAQELVASVLAGRKVGGNRITDATRRVVDALMSRGAVPAGGLLGTQYVTGGSF